VTRAVGRKSARLVGALRHDRLGQAGSSACGCLPAGQTAAQVVEFVLLRAAATTR
jgi:hypothetical protein